MYLIVNKEDSRVMLAGEKLSIQANGYPFLENERTAFPDFMVDTYEVSEVPGDYTADKYCYTPGQGFYLNPDWEEPTKNLYGLTVEQIESIEQAYRDRLVKEVSENDA